MSLIKGRVGSGRGKFRRLACWALALGVLAAPSACEKPKKLRIGALQVEHQLPLTWRELEPGLSFAELDYTRKSNGEKLALAALRADPSVFQFQVLSAPELLSTPSGWLHEMFEKSGTTAAVNASFYLPDSYAPTGLAVSRGGTQSSWRKGGGSGVFWAGSGRAGVDWARAYRPEWGRADAAVQAGPLLVEPGGRPGILSNTQKYLMRTAVGLDARGDVVLLVTLRRDKDDNALFGLDLYELMELCLTPEDQGGLGLKSALNLDGGVSTAMSIAHPGLKLEIRSVQPVRNGLALMRGAPETGHSR
jgi:hypothetical protein